MDVSDIINQRIGKSIKDLEDELPIDLFKEIIELKKDMLNWALESCYGNKAQAAKLLNMNRTTFVTALTDLEKDKTGKNRRAIFYKRKK